MFLGARHIYLDASVRSNSGEVYQGYLDHLVGRESAFNHIDHYVEEPSFEIGSQGIISYQDVVTVIGRSGISDPDAIAETLVVMGFRSVAADQEISELNAAIGVYLGQPVNTEPAYMMFNTANARMAGIYNHFIFQRNLLERSGRMGAEQSYSYFMTNNNALVSIENLNLGLHRLAIERFRGIVQDLSVSNRLQYHQNLLMRYDDIRSIGFDPNAPRDILLRELREVYEQARTEIVEGTADDPELEFMHTRFRDDLIGERDYAWPVSDPLRFYPDMDPITLAQSVFLGNGVVTSELDGGVNYEVSWEIEEMRNELDDALERWDHAVQRWYEEGNTDEPREYMSRQADYFVRVLVDLRDRILRLQDRYGVYIEETEGNAHSLAVLFSMQRFISGKIESIYDVVVRRHALDLQVESLRPVNSMVSYITRSRVNLPVVLDSTPEGARIIQYDRIPDPRDDAEIRILSAGNNAYDVIELTNPQEDLSRIRLLDSGYIATVVRDSRGRIFLMRPNDARIETREVRVLETDFVGKREAAVLYGYTGEPLPAEHGTAITHRTISGMNLFEMRTLLQRRYGVRLVDIQDFSDYRGQDYFVIVQHNNTGNRQIFSRKEFELRYSENRSVYGETYHENIENPRRIENLIFRMGRGEIDAVACVPDENRNTVMPVVLPNRSAVIFNSEVFINRFERVHEGNMYEEDNVVVDLYLRENVYGDQVYFAVPYESRSYLLDEASFAGSFVIPDSEDDAYIRRIIDRVAEDELPTGRITHSWEHRRENFVSRFGEIDVIRALLQTQQQRELTPRERRDVVERALRVRLDMLVGAENNPLRNRTRFPRVARELANCAIRNLNPGEITPQTLGVAVEVTMRSVDQDQEMRRSLSREMMLRIERGRGRSGQRERDDFVDRISTRARGRVVAP